MNSVSKGEYVFILKNQIQKLKDISFPREEVTHILTDINNRFPFIEQIFVERSMRAGIWPIKVGYTCSDVILASRRIAYIDILEKEMKMITKNGSLLKPIATGTGLVLVAAGVARLILELAKEHPEAAKAIVSGANELGNLAADNISCSHHEKPAIEAVKKGKDIMAEIANYQLDEYHNSYKRRYYA